MYLNTHELMIDSGKGSGKDLLCTRSWSIYSFSMRLGTFPGAFHTHLLNFKSLIIITIKLLRTFMDLVNLQSYYLPGNHQLFCLKV